MSCTRFASSDRLNVKKCCAARSRGATASPVWNAVRIRKGFPARISSSATGFFRAASAPSGPTIMIDGSLLLRGGDPLFNQLLVSHSILRKGSPLPHQHVLQLLNMSAAFLHLGLKT